MEAVIDSSRHGSDGLLIGPYLLSRIAMVGRLNTVLHHF